MLNKGVIVAVAALALGTVGVPGDASAARLGATGVSHPASHGSSGFGRAGVTNVGVAHGVSRPAGQGSGGFGRAGVTNVGVAHGVSRGAAYSNWAGTSHRSWNAAGWRGDYDRGRRAGGYGRGWRQDWGGWGLGTGLGVGLGLAAGPWNGDYGYAGPYYDDTSGGYGYSPWGYGGGCTCASGW
jgi:hypothetical protein